MDLGNLAIAAFLGIIEGITEFLPISSTAHIRLGQAATHFQDPDGTFAVVIQLGAILAVVILMWARIQTLIMGVLRRDPQQRRFAYGLGFALLPPGILGVLANSWLEKNVFSAHELIIISVTMVVGGLVILAVERFCKTPRYSDASTIPLTVCVGIGFLQVLALIPGVSRSGASIMGGMGLGVSRQAATEFSFLLAIPLMMGASLLKLVKHPEHLTNPDRLAPLAVGFVVSFVVALVVVRWLLRYVATKTFVPFAYYRLALGVVIGVLLLTGVLRTGVAT